MFVNASQLTIQPPPLNRSNSLTVLDMSSAAASHPVPLLQPLNVPRYMPQVSHARMPALDSTPPQAQMQLPLNTKSIYEWPGPGPRIASLLPPEHLGTPLISQRNLANDVGYNHTQAAAYPYAAQNFWIGGTDQNQNGDTSFGMLNEENSGNQDLAKRRHVCPVCDKRFNRPSSLNTHMAVHTGAKPFVCGIPDCGRRFSVSSNLRRHEKTHNIRSRDDKSPYSHQTTEKSSIRSSYMTHGSSSSIPNMPSLSMISTTSGHRPSMSYSDTSRYPPSYPSMSFPSTDQYTPYQTYSYPIPQAHGHGHGNDGLPQHLSPYQYGQNSMTLPQPLPSCASTVDFGDFLNAMPLSASGIGINLEDYQVISGSKQSRDNGVAGEHGNAIGSISRVSSSSDCADVVQTPQLIEVGRQTDEADADGMDEDGSK